MRKFFVVLFIFLLKIPSLYAVKYVFLDALESFDMPNYTRALPHIAQENKVLVTWSQTFSADKAEYMRTQVGQVIVVDNFFLSGQVDLAVTKLASESKIAAIISPVMCELDIMRAASLREFLGVPGQSYESAVVFRNKLNMKAAAAAAGLRVAPYAALNAPVDLLKFAKKAGFPLMMKLRDGAGSAKMEKITDEGGIESFLKRQMNCHHISNWMVEGEIRGQLYHIDGYTNGFNSVIWPSVYLTNPFVAIEQRSIQGSRLLSPDDPLTERLRKYTTRLLRHFPTPAQSSFHLEVFLEEETDEIVFCEIASRVGGGFIAESWLEGMGIDLSAMYYKLQASPLEEADFAFTAPTDTVGAIAFPIENKGTIVDLPQVCEELEFCKFYSPVVKMGEKVSDGNGAILAKMAIRATNPVSFNKNVEAAILWFNSRFHMKSDES